MNFTQAIKTAAALHIEWVGPIRPGMNYDLERIHNSMLGKVRKALGVRQS